MRHRLFLTTHFMRWNRTLSLTLGYTPAVGSSFTLVDIGNSATLVDGTFAGLAQGATFVSDGQEFQISYTGGDGNDIVVTDLAAVPEPSTLAMTFVAGGFLVLLARRKSPNAI